MFKLGLLCRLGIWASESTTIPGVEKIRPLYLGIWASQSTTFPGVSKVIPFAFGHLGIIIPYPLHILLIFYNILLYNSNEKLPGTVLE
jgi:hypothetical protein